MIIVRLKGGLGNQMFQYALGRVLALKNGTKLLLDVEDLKNKANVLYGGFPARTFCLDVFNIEAKVMHGGLSIWRHLFLKNIIESGFEFNPKTLAVGPEAYLDGWWQSPKYFAGYENIIKKDFSLKKEPAPNIKELAEEIERGNSVCLHARRTDYVGNKYHEVIGPEYYQNALSIIRERGEIDKIYVFSDDINWCRQNMSFEYPTVFVGEEYRGEKDEGHLYLMRKCKYFAIANSSFSWWGAWLSEREGKIVVCPKQWFGDPSLETIHRIPKDWIRI